MSAHFAKSLKQARETKGDTLQTLAERANVSKSMISKIERNEVQPTLDVAGRLAKALGKTLSEMLHAPQNAKILFLPKVEQAIWEDSEHITRRNISPIFEGLTIEWLQIELPANTTIEKSAMTCIDEKYFLVTQGVLTITVNQQTYKLNAGDSLFFEGALDHILANETTGKTAFYIVINHKKANA